MIKKFKDFLKEETPDTPELILGKLGARPDSFPAGQSSARVQQVRKAHNNTMSPYTGKLKPNKPGKPES